MSMGICGPLARPLIPLTLILGLLVAPWSGPASAVSADPIVAVPGYQIAVFARGTTAYKNPDSITVDAGHVWVGYQNVTAKDGHDHKTSTVVEYSARGLVLRTVAVPGHCDGLRVDPATHLVWASSNEDGNPALVSISPQTGAVTPYRFPPTPHGGGYDDMAFANGKMFIAASNPTLNKSGVNVFPALDTVAFNGHDVVLTPVLLGNAPAKDRTTGSRVTLNLIDPDSLALDGSGDVVLVNQGGSEVVFLHRAGTAQQTVSRLAVGTQVDDVAWATAATGHLLIVDGKANTIYVVRAAFKPGTVYAEAPSDSGVAGFVGTLDLKTGTLRPVMVGLGSPTGLLFVPGT